MILINKNSINEKITLTCTEKSTINEPYFIFKLVHSQNTGSEKIFYTPNLSVNKSRYDLFTIEETNSENLLEGKVSLIAGEWYYFIYECATISLDIADWLTLVESGKLNVLATETPIAFYEKTDNKIATY